MDLQSQRERLSRVVAITNDKGGVGKTSVTANVAGALAEQGMKVLVQNLDRQGDLGIDLGVAAGDKGKSVADALLYDDDDHFEVVRDVRPNLDYIAGGRGISLLHADGSPELKHRYAKQLATIAGDYDMVLLDCPPALLDILDIALHAARWVLIPVKADEGSLEGMLTVGSRVTRARKENPSLDYLGAVLTMHNPAAVQVESRVEQRLAVIKELSLFQTRIRHSESVGYFSRERGQLATELAAEDKATKSARLAALSAARKAKKDGVEMSSPVLDGSDLTVLPSLAAAARVAVDYQGLAAEICARITAAEVPA